LEENADNSRESIHIEENSNLQLCMWIVQTSLIAEEKSHECWVCSPKNPGRETTCPHYPSRLFAFFRPNNCEMKIKNSNWGFSNLCNCWWQWLWHRAKCWSGALRFYSFKGNKNKDSRETLANIDSKSAFHKDNLINFTEAKSVQPGIMIDFVNLNRSFQTDETKEILN